MTDKELFFQFLDESYESNYDYFSVLIDTENSNGYELIVNPMCNYVQKRECYDRAYNDDLVLNSFNGIRIVNYDACYGEIELGDLFLKKEKING